MHKVARLIYLLTCALMQIYVVDSLDRERIGKAKQEFQVTKSNSLSYVCACYSKQILNWFMDYLQTIINDPFMLNSVILVFANKQDLVCVCYFFFICVLLVALPEIKVISTTGYHIGAKHM